MIDISHCTRGPGATRTFVSLLFAVIVAGLAGPADAQGGLLGAGTTRQSSEPAAATNALDSLRNLFRRTEPEPSLLPPELAFQMNVQARDADTLVAELRPSAGYYLYRDRITFIVTDPAGVAVDSVTLPKGEPKSDPTFGSVEVYHGAATAVITLKQTTPRAERIRLQATYQGCNEPLGVCYPPIDQTVTVSLVGLAADATAPPASVATAAAAVTSRPTEQTMTDVDPWDEGFIRGLFAGSSAWVTIAAFFGFGVLLAFTPCMLPMIPILSGIIVGQGRALTRRRALGLTSVYVLAMAITYAVAGVVAGLAGTLVSAYLQNAWVLGGFAAIFVLLALSMFGLFDLQLPVALQSRLSASGSQIKGGRITGVFLMGMLSAVIMGPCVAAPLAGALLYIGQTGDVVFGGTALFMMAIGMGLPLMVVGATTGTLLPKAGKWTESVMRVFGVGMLALAVYTLTPVIPVVVQQLLWAALLIVPAIYLHALDPLPAESPGYRRLFKGIGVLALLLGTALMIGALSGHREILQPLAGLRGGDRIERRELAFLPVGSLAELSTQMTAAHGRPVMLDFWAEWCVSCKEMDQFTFSDSRVQARLEGVVLLRADVTANNDEHRALLARFSLFGPPGIIFFDKEGKESSVRVIGFQSPERFLASLDRGMPGLPSL